MSDERILLISSTSRAENLVDSSNPNKETTSGKKQKNYKNRAGFSPSSRNHMVALKDVDCYQNEKSGIVGDVFAVLLYTSMVVHIL